MKIATATLTGVAPYSQSRRHEAPKLDKEAPDDYERRTWRERLHVDSEGFVFIPPMAFKNCVAECAKYLGEKVPGKGKATYTKHFEAGVLVPDPVRLPVKACDVVSERLFVPADGVRGSGKRVAKHFPVIPDWTASVVFYVFDETITRDAFHHHLSEAGKFIGIGRFRPRCNGFYGRFTVDELSWTNDAAA